MITFPREPVIEFFLNGWKEVTTDVRQDPGITITRGRKDESSKLSPAKCTFTLDDGPDHGNGDYNPHNPLGQWYRYLKRNIPVRVSLKAGFDDFNRTVVSGWGTSPSDGNYTDLSSGTTAGSVSGGQGIHDITTTSSYRTSYLDDINVKGVRLTTDVTINGISNVTGGNLEPANLILRGQSSSTYYMLRIVITASETVEIRLMSGDSQTLDGPYTISGLTYSGQTLRVSFQADANTFRGKVWNASSLEPLTWNLAYSHGDVFNAGWLGIRSGVATGNTNTKPISYRYDNVIINIDRFTGETSKLVPLTEVDHSNQRTQVECAGILRRLSQGKKPLHSAARRYLTSGTVTLTDYWPLEEEVDETAKALNVVEGIPGKFVPGFDAAGIKWGVRNPLVSTKFAIELSRGAQLDFKFRNGSLTNSWTVAWFQRVSEASSSFIFNAVSSNDITFTINSAGIWDLKRNSGAPVTLFSGTLDRWGEEDLWRLVGVSCVDLGGGQVRYEFAIDEFGNGVWMVLASTTQSVSYTKPIGFNIASGVTFNTPSAYSHIAVFSEILGGGFNLFSSFDRKMYGDRGEFAGDRFNRLCDEEGISRGMVGYPTLTRTMGPQAPLTLLELLHECVIADHGSMFDFRGDIAIGMRTSRSVVGSVGRPSIVTLNYLNNEIAPTFGPTTDDQKTVNDVTAKRPGGGQYQHIQTTGSMNINDPGTDINGVGRVDTTQDFNLQHDGLLIDAASWTVHLGTVDEPRFPTIPVNMAASSVKANTSLTYQLLDADIDDVLTATNLQERKIYDSVRQVIRGYSEKFDTAYLHEIEFNCTPASPYDSAVLDNADARQDSDTSTLNTQFIAGTNTSMSVASTGGTLWTTSAGDFPFNIKIEGCVLTVTNITGSSSPQTFTITQTPVNGVSKTLLVGDKIKLADPIYLTL